MNALTLDSDESVLGETRLLSPRETRTRTGYVDQLKAEDLLRPDLEAELRRLDFEMVEEGMLDFDW